MSTLLLSLAKENQWPGLAVASLNLVVALSLVGRGQHSCCYAIMHPRTHQ